MKIARDVESAIFRGVELDQGKVDVSVAEGVVGLRGEVPSQRLIGELETRAAEVSDVRRVENLLQLAESPTPSTDAAAPQSESEEPAARPDDRATTPSERSDELPAPPSAPRSSDFGTAGPEPRPAHAASGGEPADPGDGSPAGDEAAEHEGPDTAELDKDPAYQPNDPGLRHLKGG